MKHKVKLRVALVKRGLEFLGFFRISDGRTSRDQCQVQLGQWSQGESNGK
jgi:hypothetical protein